MRLFNVADIIHSQIATKSNDEDEDDATEDDEEAVVKKDTYLFFVCFGLFINIYYHLYFV